MMASEARSLRFSQIKDSGSSGHYIFHNPGFWRGSDINCDSLPGKNFKWNRGFWRKTALLRGVTLDQNQGSLRNLFMGAFLRWNLMSHFRYRYRLWKYIMARDCRKRVLRKWPNVRCTENGQFALKLKKSNGTKEKFPWLVKNRSFPGLPGSFIARDT